MARMTLKFKPDYEDYLNVSQAATFNRPTLVLVILMGVVSIATILALGLGWLSVDNERLLLYLLPPMMFIFFLLYTPVNLRRTAKKSAKESVETEWRVNNAGIAVSKGEETTKYSWESFGYVEESEGHYLFFSRTNRANYIFIPKAAFTDPAEETAFRELVTEHLGAFKH
ncbi:MAG: YcxB family protein [Anaerolineaceae bacterium]|nr:YcxB family protein [Anaerolineaceae bacterium]